MSVAALVAAVALVALTTNPHAFDLLPMKRALFLMAASLPLLLPAMQRAFVRASGGPVKAWLVALALWVLSAAVAIDPYAGGIGVHGGWVLRATLEFALVVLVIVHAREVAWEGGGRLIGGLLLLGALLGGIAVAQALGFDLVYGKATARVPVATFGNTNAFAAFAAPLFALSFARAARPKAFVAAIATVLLGAALVLARGRGGWLAALAGAAVGLLALRGRGIPMKRPLLLGAVALLLGAGINFAVADTSELGNKPLGLGVERKSNVVRMDVARGTLALLKAHPWLGVGPGDFRDNYPLYRPEREAKTPTREGAASEVDHPHCEPLRLAAEGGLLMALGVFAALLATLQVLRRAPRAVRDDDGVERAALLGGVVAFAVAALTWSSLYDPASALLGATLLGAALAGEVEMVIARAQERPLALALCVALVVGAVRLAEPTLRAEWVDACAARDGTLDRSELDALADVAEDDSLNLERQYAIGLQFLAAARADTTGTDLFLQRADRCFRRALELVPNHVGSLLARAEVEARRGGEEEARRLLSRVHQLEPWRGAVDPALHQLLADVGQEVAAARAKLAAEGDAAIPALKQEAERLREAGRVRSAAQVLDLVADRAPEDGDLQRTLALCLKELGDEGGYGAAYRRSQLAFALQALVDSRSEEARGNLKLARRFAPPGSALEELLEACVDLQRGKSDEARARLAGLDAAAARAAWDGASPGFARALRLLAAHPALKSEVERLGLGR